MPKGTQLRPKDLQKLSAISGVSADSLEKLNALNLISVPSARDTIIYHYYRLLKKRRKYTTSQITDAIMKEFGISRSQCGNIFYQKKELHYYCDKCFKRVSKTMYENNDGLCKRCVATTIELE